MKKLFFNIALCGCIGIMMASFSLCAYKRIDFKKPMPAEWLAFDSWPLKKQRHFFNEYSNHIYRPLIRYMFPKEPFELNKDLCCIHLPNIKYKNKNVLVAGYQAYDDDCYVIKLYDIDSKDFDVAAQITVRADKYQVSNKIEYARLTAFALNDWGILYVAEYAFGSLALYRGKVRCFDLGRASYEGVEMALRLPITAMCCAPCLYPIRMISYWDGRAYIDDRYLYQIVPLEKKPVLELKYDDQEQGTGRCVHHAVRTINSGRMWVNSDLKEKLWKLPHNRSIGVKQLSLHHLDFQWFIVEAKSKQEYSFLIATVALQVCELIDRLNKDIDRVRKEIHADYIKLLRKVPFPCTAIKQLLALIDADEKIVDLRVAYDG